MTMSAVVATWPVADSAFTVTEMHITENRNSAYRSSHTHELCMKYCFLEVVKCLYPVQPSRIDNGWIRQERRAWSTGAHEATPQKGRPLIT